MRLSELLTQSLLGPIGEGKRFDSFVERGGSTVKAKAVCQRWVAGYARNQRAGSITRGLYMYGEPGSGKTHLACAVVNELIREHALPAVFMKVWDLPRNDQSVIEELADGSMTPMLVLDDLGVEKLTPRMMEIVTWIVDGRLWSGGTMLITSNMDLDALTERMDSAEGSFPGCGQRVAGRIREVCSILRVDADDRRKEF